LETEWDAPGFASSAFGGGDMSLKLYRVGATFSYDIDVGVSCAQAPVMGLRNFSDDRAAIGIKKHG